MKQTPQLKTFKFIKNDKSTVKIPLVSFISKLSHKVNTLAKEFIDDIIKGLSKDDNFTKKNRKDLEKLQTYQQTDTLDEETVTVKSPDKEKSSEGKKQQKKRGHSSYLREPPTKMRFISKKDEKSDRKEKASFNTLEFRKFKKENWVQCSKSHKDMKSCEVDIKKRWKILNNDFKKKLKQNTICCENETSDLPTVHCYICNNIFHPDCVQYDSELAFLSDKFCCKSCIIANFQGFINFLHTSLRFSYHEVSIAKSLSAFNEMNLQRIDALRLHSFLPLNISAGSIITIQSKQGISNRYNNCWLSSLLQCLLGTNIAAILRKVTFDEAFMQHTRSITSQLSSFPTDNKGIFPLPALDFFSTMCGFELKAEGHRDPCEAFDKFVEYINAEEVFCGKVINISRCDFCNNVYGGSKCIGSCVEIKLPGYLNTSPSMENLIWNTFTGQYLPMNDGGDWCPKCRKLVGAQTFSFFTHCPAILPLKLDRVDFDTKGRINMGEVTLNKVLNLYALSPNFTSTLHNQYTLVSCITIEGGKSTRSNHFASFLFDFQKNQAVQFDDEHITKFSLDELITMSSFQQSVYMIFYIRNDCLTDSFRKKELSPYFVSVAKQINIESTIFNEHHSISEEDFRILTSILGNNHLIGDAVSSFVAYESEKSALKVASATSNLLFSVQSGFCSAEYYHFCNRLNISEFDLIAIPYHHKSTSNDHWSLFIIYSDHKVIIHIDSLSLSSIDGFNTVLHLIRQNYKCQQKPFLTNEWKCIKPDGIPQQTDAASCGVWCCINAFKIIHEKEFVCYDEDLPMVRYWVAEKVSKFERKKLGVKDGTSHSEGMSLPMKGSLNIIKNVPCELNGTVFEKLFQFRRRKVDVTVKKENTRKNPERKSAQESKSKIAILINLDTVDETKQQKRKVKKTKPKVFSEYNKNYRDDGINKCKDDNHNANADGDDDIGDKMILNDDYGKILQHKRKCQIKVKELIKYREFDRNVQKIVDKKSYIPDMMKYIKSHQSFPQKTGENIKLAIDKERGSAMIYDGNHRLTCASNMDISFSPQYVKVDFLFQHLSGDKTLLPSCPKEWPTFLCGCDLGFTTNIMKKSMEKPSNS